MTQFLEEVSKLFNVILYTASESIYAEAVLRIIDPEKKYFMMKLFRQNCVHVQNGIFLKIIEILFGLNKKQCLFVDNSPFHLYDNLENGIPILPYFGETEDSELLKLLGFLREIKAEKNYIPFLVQQFKLKSYREEKDFEGFIRAMLS